ncbi:site-specific integrase [Rhodoglobus sp.]
MGRRALQPGESGPIRSSAEVREYKTTDRYGKPVTRNETVWTARANRRATESKKVERRSAIAPTKAEAETKLRRNLQHDVKKTSGVGAAVTVEDFASMWLRMKIVEAKLAPTSLSAYEHAITVHLIPALGSYRVGQLTTRPIKDWLTALHVGTLRQPGSPACARQARSVLHGVLDLAEEHHAVAENPMNGMKLLLPQEPRKDAVIVPADRVEAMFARADLHTNNNGRLGMYLRIQLGSGARIGEILALRRRDYMAAIDEKPARILIDGTIIAAVGTPVYRSPKPKTSTSRRNIPITDYAAEAIDGLLAALDARGLTSPDELLFQTVHGAPVSMNNIRRTWRDVRGDLPGLEKLKPHALRATMASSLTYAIGPDKAARQLGHLGTATLFNYYLLRREFVDDVDISSMNIVSSPEASQ